MEIADDPGRAPAHGYKLNKMNEEDEAYLCKVTNVITNLWDALNTGQGRVQDG